MTWKILKTDEDYDMASSRLMEIFDAEPNSPESEELELLMLLVKDYDERHFEILQPDPISAIKLKMLERGIRAKDLEPIVGSKGHVSSILSGRREITLKIAQKLRVYFNLPAQIFFPAS